VLRRDVQQGQGIGQPEGAGQKRSLARRQAIDLWGGGIAGHEAIGHQMPFDRLHGAAHPRIAWGQEAHQWDHQEAGIEGFPLVVLHEGVALGIKPPLADLRMDDVTELTPALNRALHAMTLEWVKCRFGPRISQIPSSGWRQADAKKSSSARCSRQASSSGFRPNLAAT
jgi:hypothetical protein